MTGTGIIDRAEPVAKDKYEVEVEGRTLRLSNLDRVLYPETGFTKGDLIGFYERYVRVLFDRYGHRVKYWLTFNEINSVIHANNSMSVIPGSLRLYSVHSGQ